MLATSNLTKRPQFGCNEIYFAGGETLLRIEQGLGIPVHLN